MPFSWWDVQGWRFRVVAFCLFHRLIAFFWLSKVDAAISLCSEMHDMKEAIYEYKKKLEGIGEDYQIQVLQETGFIFYLLLVVNL